MTRDIHVLMQVLQIVIIVTAVCTTSVPVVYSFGPWASTPLGRRFMLQAIAFAAAIDITALFSVWQPKQIDILVLFWLDIIIMSAVALSTAGIAIWIVKTNLIRK